MSFDSARSIACFIFVGKKIIVVQVNKVEQVGFNGFKNHIQWGMGTEPDRV